MRKIFSSLLVITPLVISGCSSLSGYATDTTYRQSARTAVVADRSDADIRQERMMLFNRQLSMLQDKLTTLETERSVLLKELQTVRVEARGYGSGKKQTSQINEYQAAVASSQAKMAQTEAKAVVENAVIESEIDTQIASIEASTLRLVADLEANRSQSNQGTTTKLVADIQAKKTLEITQLNNSRRLKIAKISAEAKTVAASVVSPILSEHGVHGSPSFVKASISTNKTAQTVIRKVRKIYDVMYLFTDRKSWRHFNKFLTAYGVHDKFSVVAKDTGEFVTYVGRFYTEKDALARKKELTRKTKTDHAIIRKKEITL
jgi:hypothetical protein